MPNLHEENIVEKVKELTDIVKIIGEHVELKKSGARYLGLCPFHGEKTPSFSVNSAQQFYYCFGCGESGDVFSFLMKYHHMDFPQALKFLADRLNIELPESRSMQAGRKRAAEEEPLFAVTKKAAEIYRTFLAENPGGAPGREYLQRRGISSETQRQFELGYAPSPDRAGWGFLAKQLSAAEQAAAEKVGLLKKNDRGRYYDSFRDRLLCPIFDERGRPCGFGGRIVGDGMPKYYNSADSPIFSKGKLLFGLFQHQNEIRRQRRAVLVEGNFDMLSLADQGCRNVIASLGTALTPQHIQVMRRYVDEMILLFDGDSAGVKAAVRSVPVFLSEKMAVRIALLPEGHDPDSFVREKGVGAVQELLNSAEELPEFMLQQLIAQHGLGLDGKRRIAEELKKLVEAASSAVERSVMTAHFAEKLGLSAEQLEKTMRQEVLPAAAPGRLAEKKRSQEKLELRPAQRRLVEFLVMNPEHFAALEERGIRDVLAGSVGEVIYLQVRALRERGAVTQPEDILTSLPEGPERRIVSNLLLTACSRRPGGVTEDEEKSELADLCEWLLLEQLKVRSRGVDAEIAEAQRLGDSEALARGFMEKQKLEQEVRKMRG